MPSREFGRFLVVGVWNTFFGYGVFALFNFLLAKQFPQVGYVIASVLSSIINITVAFLGYKWFVFRTSGNYLREWLRTVSVYSVGIGVSILLLPLVVYLLRWSTSMSHERATYVGGFVLTILSALWNFIGNRNYSFRKTASAVEK